MHCQFLDGQGLTGTGEFNLGKGVNLFINSTCIWGPAQDDFTYTTAASITVKKTHRPCGKIYNHLQVAAIHI